MNEVEECLKKREKVDMKKALFMVLVCLSMGLSAGSNEFTNQYKGIIQVRVRFHAETKIGCKPTRVATLEPRGFVKLGGACIVKKFEWRRGKKGKWATVKSSNSKKWIFPANEAWGPVAFAFGQSSEAQRSRSSGVGSDSSGILIDSSVLPRGEGPQGDLYYW